MKKQILVLLLTTLTVMAYSQTTTIIVADSTKIGRRDGGNNELIIENSTRNKTGAFLKNNANGRTQFAFAVDSIYVNIDTIFWNIAGRTYSLKINSAALQKKWYTHNILNDSATVTNNDWTTVIQSALDNYDVVYLPNRSSNYVLSNSLKIKSNTTLILDPKATIYLKDSTNTCFIRNKNLLAATPDSNITIIGGSWNGNYYGQQDFYPDCDTAGLAGMISMAGVKNFNIKNATIFNIRGFAIHTTSAQNFTVSDIRVAKPSRDAVHLSGANSKFVLENISGETGDAFVALNAWDWTCCTPMYGNITDGVVQNLTPFRSAAATVAILPGGRYTIDNVTFKNITGESFSQPIYIADLPDAGNPSNTIGPGYVGSLYFENIATSCTPDTAMFYLGTRIKNLVIKGVVNERPNHPVIFQKAGYTTDYLTIEDLFSKPDTLNLVEGEKGHSAILKVHGTINTLQVSNSKADFDTTTITTYPFIRNYTTGNIRNLLVSNHQQKNGVFLQNWGTIGYSSLSNTNLGTNQISDLLATNKTSLIDSAGNMYIYANTGATVAADAYNQFMIHNADVTNSRAAVRVAANIGTATIDMIQYNGIGVDSGNIVRPNVGNFRNSCLTTGGLSFGTPGDLRFYSGTPYGTSVTERLRVNTLGRVLMGNPVLTDDGTFLQINGGMNITLPAGYRSNINGSLSGNNFTTVSRVDSIYLKLSGGTITGTTITGSASTPAALTINQTWNTSGTPSAFIVDVTNIASGTSSYLADFRVGGSRVLGILKNGVANGTGFTASGNMEFGSTGNLVLGARGFFNATADGIFQLRNAATTGFNRLTFGPATASFGAIKANGTELQVRLGDDSNFSFIEDLYRRAGVGSPEGVVTAPVGAIYHRKDGGTGTAVYFKESGTGNTGWVAK